jgi:ribosome-binding protein aMBF1 (putative translation factor)
LNSEYGLSRTKKRTSNRKKTGPQTKSKTFTEEQLLRSMAEVIRDRRLALLMTQLELARCANLERTYIVDLEGGARNLSVPNISRLAAALHFKNASDLVATAERKLRRNREWLK